MITFCPRFAQKAPRDRFEDFLSGYASTVIIGGDIRAYLERKAEESLKYVLLRVKSFPAERLGMLLETFIIVMVMMSLCFYILFTVGGKAWG